MLLKIIRRHLRRNQLFVMIFVMCQVISVVACCFVVSYSSAKIEYNKQFDESIRTIEIYDIMDEDERCEIVEVTKKYAGIIDKVIAWSSFDGQIIKNNISGYQEKEKYISIGEYLSCSNNNEILINPLSAVEHRDVVIGDTIDILGENYEVVGIFPYDYIEIYGYSNNLSSTVEKHEIIFSYDADENLVGECTKKISEICNDVIPHIEQNAKIFPLNAYETIVIALILILTNINFSSLYMYIIDEDAELINTFKLVGCTRSKIINYFMWEILIFCTVAMVFAIATFQLLVAPILANINLGLNFDLSFSHILIVMIEELIGVIFLYSRMLRKRLVRKDV